MTQINTSKVLIGGLVAGLVMNIIDFVTNNVIMGAAWADVAKAHNLDAAAMQSTSVIMGFVALDFAYGLLAVWFYAAMRPRFGPGPRTAATTGVGLWALTSVVILYFVLMGWFSMSLFAEGCLFGFVSSVVGTVAGAKFYSE